MEQLYLLRDIDNRDDDGAPYETVGPLEFLAEYIDGPLRSDLTDDADLDTDEIVAAMRGRKFSDDHAAQLRSAGVWITRVEGEQ